MLLKDNYLCCMLCLSLYFMACNSHTKATVNRLDEIESNDSAFSPQDTLQKSEAKELPCRQIECQVWARVNISEQQMYVYRNGGLTYQFQVTTGNDQHKTPLMDKKPSGPMYVKYMSKKFPGGNYMGLGNMPYVVFVRGGYAIHGTTTGNIKLLGKKVSHGCIRLHPDNAKIFYEMIKEIGLRNVWVTVEP